MLLSPKLVKASVLSEIGEDWEDSWYLFSPSPKCWFSMMLVFGGFFLLLGGNNACCIIVIGVGIFRGEIKAGGGGVSGDSLSCLILLL